MPIINPQDVSRGADIANIAKSADSLNQVINFMQQAFSQINQQAEQTADNINKNRKKNADIIQQEDEATAKKIDQEKLESTKEQTKLWEKAAAAFTATISTGLGKLADEFEQKLHNYVDTYQSLSYNLIGSGMDYNTIQNALSVLGTNAFVKQQTVYDNLRKLVESGITYNVAQRAYLQTATEQVGLQLNQNAEKFNNLIQLYRADISEARAGQMAGLKIFLEQNYKNSQYIREGFASVSDALYEMQSIMTVQNAMLTEKTIQTYLGSFRSAGGSSRVMGSLATAINQIGSGDFNLDNGMQNLLVMAAARSGLSYADLLTGGLTEADANKLMQGVFNYASSLEGIGGGSNVAMNAIAKIFGLSVADIKAAQNMGLGTNGLATNWNSSIGSFFGNFANSTAFSTKLSTWWDNALSAQAFHGGPSGWWGPDAAGTVGWDLYRSITGLAGGGIQAAGQAAGGGIGTILSLLGTGISNLPGLGILAGIVGNSIGSIFSSTKALKEAGKDPGGLVQKLLTGLGFGENTTYADFLQLGGIDGSASYSSTGTFTSGKGASRSGKITNAAGSETQVTIEEGEAPESKTLDDLYSLLADDFPVTTFNTATELVDGVFIGNAQTTQYITDMLTITAVSTENIFMLLENALAGGTNSLINTRKISLETSWGDLFGTK